MSIDVITGRNWSLQGEIVRCYYWMELELISRNSEMLLLDGTRAYRVSIVKMLLLDGTRAVLGELVRRYYWTELKLSGSYSKMLLLDGTRSYRVR